MKSHTFGESRFVTTDDGRKLHYMVNGTGSHTVVFESGMGLSRSCWGLVQPLIARHARAVVYDRAGAGRSESDPAPRTLKRITQDLHALLQALGPGPFILVGHSWGGPIVRVAAAQNPGVIRGLVLIDQSDEHADVYFSGLVAKQFAFIRFLTPLMVRIGLYRLLGNFSGRKQPADVSTDHRNEDFTMKAAQTTIAETRPFIDEMRFLRSHPPLLGNLEVSLISGTKLSWTDSRTRPAIIAAHRKTTASLANARWTEAAASSHMVIFSEPEVIVKEILRMLD